MKAWFVAFCILTGLSAATLAGCGHKPSADIDGGGGSGD